MYGIKKLMAALFAIYLAIGVNACKTKRNYKGGLTVAYTYGSPSTEVELPVHSVQMQRCSLPLIDSSVQFSEMLRTISTCQGNDVIRYTFGSRFSDENEGRARPESLVVHLFARSEGFESLEAGIVHISNIPGGIWRMNSNDFHFRKINDTADIRLRSVCTPIFTEDVLGLKLQLNGRVGLK